MPINCSFEFKVVRTQTQYVVDLKHKLFIFFKLNINNNMTSFSNVIIYIFSLVHYHA